MLELEMTSFQWAGLVSSHSGNGVPCTIGYITPHGTGNIPLIESQNTNEEQANREIEASLRAMMREHQMALEAIAALVAKGRATKKELQDVLDKASYIHRKLPEVTAHALSTFKENSETIMAKANAEVEASINSLIVRTGVQALGISPLGLEDKG